MITAFASRLPIDPIELYRSFLEREGDRSGTVVLHHGRVKRPGKKAPGFSMVELRSLVPNADERLAQVAHQAKKSFDLNQVLVVHRLGILGAGGTLLVAIVSGMTRDRCFSACSWIVDEIKKEEFIELVERP